MRFVSAVALAAAVMTVAVASSPADAQGRRTYRGDRTERITFIDENGRVEFTTIYPGWYAGRTVHVHARIHLDATTVLVTQLYFPDSLTDTVYAGEPYSSRPERDTMNDDDGVAGSSLDDLLLELTAVDGGYVGSIIFGVTL